MNRWKAGMKIAAAVAVAATLLAGCNPAKQMAMSEAQADSPASERRMGISEYRRWQNEVKKRTRQLKRMTESNIEWGDELRAHGSNMIVLDPAWHGGTDPGKVSVEVFQRWVDDDGKSIASIHARKFVFIDWFTRLRLQDDVPVTLLAYTIGSGPGLSEEFADANEILQEADLTLMIGYRGSKQPEVATLRKQILKMGMEGTLRTVDREVDLLRLVRRAGLDEEEWERKAKKRREGLIPAINERWRQVAEAAMAQMPNVFYAVPDPVIVIDGKYLVTQNTVRRQGGMDAPQRVNQGGQLAHPRAIRAAATVRIRRRSNQVGE